MELKAGQRADIDNIKLSMDCPKGFECEQSNFTKLSEVRDLGITDMVQCLSDTPEQCTFAVPFGFGHFCKCPLRVYLARELNI